MVIINTLATWIFVNCLDNRDTKLSMNSKSSKVQFFFNCTYKHTLFRF